MTGNKMLYQELSKKKNYVIISFLEDFTCILFLSILKNAAMYSLGIQTVQKYVKEK